MKKAKESKTSHQQQHGGGYNKIQNDSLANESRMDEDETLVSGETAKTFKKDYDIDVQLKDNEKPSLILYK